jgi:phage protein D
VPKYFAPSFRIDVNGSRLEGDVSKNIQQVEVVSMPDTLDTFTFTLVNALPGMRWTHSDDAKLFKPGNSVSILMGYVDDLHEMMEGEITQVSPTFPSSGTPTVEIQGHSRMHRLRGDNKTQTFQNVTAKQIVQKIGQDAGLDVKADDVDVQQDYVIQPNVSDLEFLKSIAKSLHFELLVQNKTLIFRKAQEAAAKAFTFIWFGTQESFTPTPDTLPLKSFSPQMDALAPATTVQYRGYDMKSKKPFVSNASSTDQATKMGGTQSGADVSQTAFQMPRNVVHVTSPFDNKETGDQMAKSTLNEKALNLVKGSAETIGVPELWSGQVVELKGLGPVFSGNYVITEATHTIGESGYQTSFKVKRNATS